MSCRINSVGNFPCCDGIELSQDSRVPASFLGSECCERWELEAVRDRRRKGHDKDGGVDSEKSLCPSNFLPAILGPEMAAPILWAPAKMRSFCRKKKPAHKIPRCRGGYFGFVFFGGGKCRFFHGRKDFSDKQVTTDNNLDVQLPNAHF